MRSESCTDGQTTASRERAEALLGMATASNDQHYDLQQSEDGHHSSPILNIGQVSSQDPQYNNYDDDFEDSDDLNDIQCDE